MEERSSASFGSGIGITQKEPLYSHDLVILAKHAKITLDDKSLNLLARVNIYNIRARYQDYKMSLYKQASRIFVTEELVRINQIAKRIAPEIEAFPVSAKVINKNSNPFFKEAAATGIRML